MKKILAFVVLCLAVPLVFAQQPTVGLSYSGGYPICPSYVDGYPNELAAQFNVGNSGTELGLVNLSLGNATDEFSIKVTANDFVLTSGERRDLTIFFLITNATPIVSDLTLTILISQVDAPQNVSGVGRASFMVPISLDLNTNSTIQLTDLTRIPIPEFEPLILMPLMLLVALITMRKLPRRRFVEALTADQYVEALLRTRKKERRGK